MKHIMWHKLMIKESNIAAHWDPVTSLSNFVQKQVFDEFCVYKEGDSQRDSHLTEPPLKHQCNYWASLPTWEMSGRSSNGPLTGSLWMERAVEKRQCSQGRAEWVGKDMKASGVWWPSWSVLPFSKSVVTLQMYINQSTSGSPCSGSMLRAPGVTRCGAVVPTHTAYYDREIYFLTADRVPCKSWQSLV